MRNYILVSLAILILLFAFSENRSLAQQPTAGPYNNYLAYIAAKIPNLWIGPDGGSIVCLAVYPANPQIMYAGTWGAGVFRSTDGGATWVGVNSGLNNLQINALAVDPNNYNIVYAGPYREKLYKTTNGGQTWALTATGIQEQAIVYSIAVDPTNSSRVYISTRGISNNNNRPWKGIIYRTTNGGATWIPALENVGGTEQQDWAYSLAVHPLSPNQVYAAYHEYFVWRSNDYGQTWNLFNSGISDHSGRSVIINPNQLNPPNLYYGVWHQTGVYSYPTVNNELWWGITNGSSYGVKVYNMALHPLQPSLIYVADFTLDNTYGILKTTNGGRAWNGSGLEDNLVYTVAVNPKNVNTVYAGTNGDGLYMSTNQGASWSYRHTGISGANVKDLWVQPDANKSLYALVTGAGVTRRLASNQNWQYFNQGLPEKTLNALVRHPTNPNVLFALTNSSGLFRVDLSTGGAWQQYGTGLPYYDQTTPIYAPDHPFASREEMEPDSFLTVEEPVPGLDPQAPEAPLSNGPLLTMEFAPSNPSIVYMGTLGDNGIGGVYRSPDGGAYWELTQLRNITVYSIAISPTNYNVVYASTPQAGVVFYTINGGQAWTETTGLPQSIYSLEISPFDASRVYAGTNDGVYVRQGSANWTRVGLAGIRVTVVKAHPTRANVILAGTDKGYYISYNAGGTWNQGDAELIPYTIQSISFDPANTNFVYFSTQSRGAVRVGIP
jgi:photosystem II stability/assembly factor-like uncharacterized protein